MSLSICYTLPHISRVSVAVLQRKKADESDVEALRAEYQHRLGTAERKVRMAPFKCLAAFDSFKSLWCAFEVI